MATTAAVSEQAVQALFEHYRVPRRHASLVAHLASAGEATASELARALAWRQPHVATVTRALLEKEWLAVRAVKRPGAGRPAHAYRLARTVEEIVESLRRAEEAAHASRAALASRILHAARRGLPVPATGDVRQ